MWRENSSPLFGDLGTMPVGQQLCQQVTVICNVICNAVAYAVAHAAEGGQACQDCQDLVFITTVSPTRQVVFHSVPSPFI